VYLFDPARLEDFRSVHAPVGRYVESSRFFSLLAEPRRGNFVAAFSGVALLLGLDHLLRCLSSFGGAGSSRLPTPGAVLGFPKLVFTRQKIEQQGPRSAQGGARDDEPGPTRARCAAGRSGTRSESLPAVILVSLKTSRFGKPRKEQSPATGAKRPASAAGDARKHERTPSGRRSI